MPLKGTATKGGSVGPPLTPEGGIMADDYKPSDPQLMLALDRAWIFRQAHKTLSELGFTSSDVMDVLAVAEFMAGVPRPSMPDVTENDGEDADPSE